MGFLSLRRRIISLLAEELKEYIPQFEPYSADYQMVIYASKDLEEWMRYKWSLNSGAFYETLGRIIENRYDEYHIFLKPWVSVWLEKWRERVRLLHTKPKLPPNVMKRLKEAKRIYQKSEFKRELKELLTRKLIRNGEICMASFIAENLIIEEITRRLRDVKPESNDVKLDPIDIYNSLSRRIFSLSKEKGPLVYLRIKPYMF